MDDRSEPLFEALADATRRRVLVALATAGPATSTQLAAAFPVTRQAIAKHLQVLAHAGVVRAEHHGRETRWTFVPGSLGPAAAWLQSLDQPAWDDSVSALQRHLEEQRRRRGLAAAPDGLRAAASKQRPTRR
jgi:DNA-binding transcriptional ArsR family regulator